MGAGVGGWGGFRGRWLFVYGFLTVGFVRFFAVNFGLAASVLCGVL